MKRTIREEVYNMYGGHCAYCGCKLEGLSDMQVDHLKPIYHNMSDTDVERLGLTRGEDDMNNYLPSCRVCNNYKGGNPLEVFRSELEKQGERAIESSSTVRRAIKYGLLEYHPHQIKFYFETYNK